MECDKQIRHTWWNLSVLTRIHLVVKNKTVRKLVLKTHGEKRKRNVRKKKSSLIIALLM